MGADGADGGSGGGADNGGLEGDPSIHPISIIEEMQNSYLDYAMSVIVSRALPDVRDGLKPVHRRILYAMHENGFDWNKPYRKSARIVGDVIGKYHPHGDSAVYDALVRMAQDFSLRVPLIQGQGNFGSIDGDPPAAMRYTESRLSKPAHELLSDLDKDTVGFRDNYDNSETEPVVLPTRFPNLLVNGAGGIAVGMATNIPPHNLSEVIDACVAMIENPAIELAEVMEIMPGPDFPTGGIILGRSGIRSAYSTGRGSVIMRGRVHNETISGERQALVVTEVPYQVNKASMVEKIAELVRDKRIEGISDIRDESDRDGYRVVIELRRDAVPDVVLNQLYRYTPLQSSFGCNLVALNGGKPERLILIDMLKAFVAFREEVVTRRTKFLLNKARIRAHVLVGLAIAVANIDEIIKLIRNAPEPASARSQLMERAWEAKDVAPLVLLIDDPRHKLNDDGTYYLSEEQARAILDLRLQRLTALGRDEISDELHTIGDEIIEYLDILGSRVRVMKIVTEEILAVKEEFSTPRRSEIIDGGFDMEDEDLIAVEDMVVTVSHTGYIKRVPLDTYRAQRRGGKGRSGMSTRDEDFVTRLFVATTHTPILFFSSRGIVYKLKVWKLPLAAPQARGKALINILPLHQGERVTSILPLPEDEASWSELDVIFATQVGTVRRNKLSDFVKVNRNGKIAMKLDEENDSIVGVDTCDPDNDILLTTAAGQCIRFPVTDVRVFAGRNSVGVRGVRLAKGDKVISMSVLNHSDANSSERIAYLKQVRAGDDTDVATEDTDTVSDILPNDRFEKLQELEEFVLTVSENGYGKRSSSHEYRVSGRGGKGISAMVVNERNGKLVASFPVSERDEIMLVSDGGQLIRCPIKDVRIAGRSTMGVTIFNTAKDEHVVSVEHISENNDDDDDGDQNEELVDGDVANGPTSQGDDQTNQG
ncbi:MAG: DNA gyrase subunit A [Hyphomicrobiales bacterium]|nr:DNA gyrase subunit A [Hyphomicrobiales bacterium]